MKKQIKLFSILVIVIEICLLSLLFFSKSAICYTIGAPFNWFHYYYIAQSFWDGIAINPGALAINILLLYFINKKVYLAVMKRKKLDVQLPQSY